MPEFSHGQRLDAHAGYDDLTLYGFALLNADTWDGQGVFEEGEIYLDAKPTDRVVSPPIPAVKALQDQLTQTPYTVGIGYRAVGYETGRFNGLNPIYEGIKSRLETARGQRWWYPAYGSNLHFVLGLPQDATARQRAETIIRTELVKDADWYALDRLDVQGTQAQITTDTGVILVAETPA